MVNFSWEGFGSGFAGAALLGFLLKNWFLTRLKASVEHEYRIKFADYESKLSAAKDVAVERLRGQLAVVAAQRNVEYERVHGQRLEFMADLFQKLSALQGAAGDYVESVPAEDGAITLEPVTQAVVEFDR